MKLILGSASASRKLILERAGYKFEVMRADIDEKAIRHEDFRLLPLLLARAKAAAILQKIKEPAILITSDQVTICNGELREKPSSPEELRKWLLSYGKNPLETITSVVVTNTSTFKKSEAVDIAKVFFKKIPPKEIGRMSETEKFLYCAGGVIIEDEQFLPYIKKIEGDAESVMGLPLKLTEKLIDQVK